MNPDYQPEIRTPKSERRPKLETRESASKLFLQISALGLRASSFLRISVFGFLLGFDLRISGFCGLKRLVAMLSILRLVCGLHAQTLSDQDLVQIRFDQKLDAQVSPSLVFRDESGRQVNLAEYFGRKPIVLVLGYYQCPMLCTLVLNGFVESAQDMKWSIGPDFEVLDVSINPAETPTLAAAKRQTYLKRYGRSEAAGGWHFLTGREPAIRQLAAEVGYHYAYDPASKEYAHPSGLVVLTPQGKVSGYLFGVTFASSELYTALRRASSNQIASPIQQLILLCFHYNPITGKYSLRILTILRLLSVLTLIALPSLILFVARRSRIARSRLQCTDCSNVEDGTPDGDRVLHQTTDSPASPPHPLDPQAAPVTTPDPHAP